MGIKLNPMNDVALICDNSSKAVVNLVFFLALNQALSYHCFVCSLIVSSIRLWKNNKNQDSEGVFIAML